MEEKFSGGALQQLFVAEVESMRKCALYLTLCIHLQRHAMARRSSFSHVHHHTIEMDGVVKSTAEMLQKR